MSSSVFTSLIGAPLDCSGRFIGTELMPSALRAAGLVQLLDIRDAGDMAVTIDSPVRDPETGIIGFQSVCASSATIRAEVGALLKRGERPLVVGGCCTLLIGLAAALHDGVGRAGLAFVDGHLDMFDGKTSPTGEAADMDLAILTGIGPRGLIDLAGPPPLINPNDIVALGHRDPDEDVSPLAPGVSRHDAWAVRQLGPAVLGAGTAKQFETEPGRFWLHLDFDVLDQEVLPAVDYRMPHGLNWDDLAALVRPLVTSPALLGADLTIYNPNLDPDRQYAKQIVEWLGAVFVV